jgi:hypothetical protein
MTPPALRLAEHLYGKSDVAACATIIRAGRLAEFHQALVDRRELGSVVTG